jgi:hypothetical protein
MGVLLCDPTNGKREPDSRAAEHSVAGLESPVDKAAGITPVVLPRALDERLAGYAFKSGMKKTELVKMVLSEYLSGRLGYDRTSEVGEL